MKSIKRDFDLEDRMKEGGEIAAVILILLAILVLTFNLLDINKSKLQVELSPSLSVHLSWTDEANNELGFEVQRADNAAFTSGIIGVCAPLPIGVGPSVPVSATNVPISCDDSSVQPSTSYWYRVRSFNAVGPSITWSNIAPIIVPQCSASAPAQTQACSTGQSGTTCATGIQTCQTGGAWGSCVAPSGCGPSITDIAPNTITNSLSPISIAVTGSGFSSTSHVLMNGVDIVIAGVGTITYNDQSALTAQLPNSICATVTECVVGPYIFRVSNAGTLSNEVTLTITSPIPSINTNGLSSPNGFVNDVLHTVTISGTNFMRKTATFEGSSLLLHFNNLPSVQPVIQGTGLFNFVGVTPADLIGQTLTATFPAQTAPGTYGIQISNPSFPTSLTSATPLQAITITQPTTCNSGNTPTITSTFQPIRKNVANTLSITGTNFATGAPGAIVWIDGSLRFVPNSGYTTTSMSIQIPANTLAFGNHLVTVVNPAPNSCASINKNLAVVGCGNNVVETGEQCDDGNVVSGDGCSSTCATETTGGGSGGGGGGGGGGSGGAVPQCNDNFDNDHDGKIDFDGNGNINNKDSGCTSASDNSEQDSSQQTLFQCNDLRDNDVDGKIDYPSDPGCMGATDDTETDEVVGEDKGDNLDGVAAKVLVGKIILWLVVAILAVAIVLVGLLVLRTYKKHKLLSPAVQPSTASVGQVSQTDAYKKLVSSANKEEDTYYVG